MSRVHTYTINDFTHVENDSIIKHLRVYFHGGCLFKEFFHEAGDSNCTLIFSQMSFAVNCNNFRETIVSIPVCDSNGTLYIGELIKSIVFEDVKTVDDVLRIMTSKSEKPGGYDIGKDNYKHLQPSGKQNKYFDQGYLFNYLSVNCDIEGDCGVYYEYSPNCFFFRNSFDLDNIKLVCKRMNSNKEYGRFSFKEPGVLKLRNSDTKFSILDYLFGRSNSSLETI